MGRLSEMVENGKRDHVIDAFKSAVDYWADKESERTQAVSTTGDAESRANIAVRAYDTGLARAGKILEDEIEEYRSLSFDGRARVVNDVLDELARTVFLPYTLEKFAISFLDWMRVLADREGVQPLDRSLVNRNSHKFRLVADRGRQARQRGRQSVDR